VGSSAGADLSWYDTTSRHYVAPDITPAGALPERKIKQMPDNLRIHWGLLLTFEKQFLLWHRCCV
jgi:hypothetical protein